MRATSARRWLVAGGLIAGLFVGRADGNGGPFVVKYPGGDPAAKGVLARLDPTLKPARETRLRVVKEDLTITFERPFEIGLTAGSAPLAHVVAAYTIENPGSEPVEIDFGFPILRGVYMNPLSMMPVPEARVQIDKEYLRPTIISNSVIYGIIRQDARQVIERGIAADAELARWVDGVRRTAKAPPATDPAAALGANKANVHTGHISPMQQVAVTGPALPSTLKVSAPPPAPRVRSVTRLAMREKLREYLTARLGWSTRDAALLVEYASSDVGKERSSPRDRWHWLGMRDLTSEGLVRENLGVLAAIGEQKATQLFAQLASRFDKQAALKYEEIFAAWGGDVRERSVDLATGQVRPREHEAPKPSEKTSRWTGDPTVYARVDYLDPNAKLSEVEKASCQAVLKNLPVVFTFAPMNLLHYKAAFPAKATRTVTVSYSQYAYLDSRHPASYQLAYVLHPASMWDDFGPIRLTIQAPKGVECKASVPVESQKADAPQVRYVATLTEAKDKTGELFVGINKAAWDAATAKPPAKTPAPAASAARDSKPRLFNGAPASSAPTIPPQQTPASLPRR